MRGKRREMTTKIDLRFRDGTSAYNIYDARLALAMIQYFHYSHSLGTYSDEDMKIFQYLGSEINNKLRSAFPPEEIKRGSPGGGVGYALGKEALLFAFVLRLV